MTNSTTTTAAASLSRFLDAFFAGRRGKRPPAGNADDRSSATIDHHAKLPPPMTEREMPGMA